MPDISVQDGGSILIFHANTDSGREWLAENCDEEDNQYWCGGLVVEPRYAMDLAQGMIADGLIVE